MTWIWWPQWIWWNTQPPAKLGFLRAKSGDSLSAHHQWVPRTATPLQRVQASQVLLKVLTINILAPIYVNKADFEGTYSALDFTSRFELLQEHLRRFDDVHILCLQEVQSDLWPKFQAALGNLGYTHSIFAPEDPHSVSTSDARYGGGNAIFVRSSWNVRVITWKVFANREQVGEALSMAGVAVQSLWSEVSMGGGNALNANKSLIARFLRNMQAVLVVVEVGCQRSAHRIVAASVQLISSPVYDDVKLLQAHLVAHWLMRTAREFEATSILTGDLNSFPSSAVYRHLTGSKINLQAESFDERVGGGALSAPGGNVLASILAAGEPISLYSAYHPLPEGTHHRLHFRGCLDYVLYRPHGRVTVVATLHVPWNETLLQPSLPSDVWPSDHLPLGAIFALECESSDYLGNTNNGLDKSESHNHDDTEV